MIVRSFAPVLKVTTLSTEGLGNWVTTGGGGGRVDGGGEGGISDIFDWRDGGGGKQGTVRSPRGWGTPMPVAFKGTRYHHGDQQRLHHARIYTVVLRDSDHGVISSTVACGGYTTIVEGARWSDTPV